MAQDKEGFVLYRDLNHTVNKLPDDMAGRLFKLILAYVNDENPSTDEFVLELTFEPIKQQLKRDLKKYDNKRQKNKENAKKRWDAIAYNRMQSNAKDAVIDSVTVTDSVSVMVSDKVSTNVDEKEKKSKPKKKFAKPTIDEIAAYCTERRNTIDANHFFDYYESKGWIVGRSPMKDWKATVRTWEKNNTTKNGTTTQAQRRTLADQTADAIARVRNYEGQSIRNTENEESATEDVNYRAVD